MSSPEFLASLRESVGDEFEVLGEIQHEVAGTQLFLGREQATGSLVLFRLEQQGEGEFALDVVAEVDGSMPGMASLCPRCGASLRPWARFCTQCRFDLSGVAPSPSGENVSRTQLRRAVEAAAEEEYQILGEMPRSEGGGLVYFARERAGGRIVALRLQQEGNEEYALGVTQVLRSAARAPVTGASAGPHYTIVPRARTTPGLRPVAPPATPLTPITPPPIVPHYRARPAASRSTTPILIVAGVAIVMVVIALLLTG